MTGFLDALDARVLICDGAMGTMLYGKGIFLNRSFDELNLTQPDLVAEIHQAYVRAGADVLETNTFGANRLKLAPFGLGERLREINAAGVRIARQAARGQAYVAGAIGPLGVRVEPWGKTGLDEAEAAFREQAAGARRRPASTCSCSRPSATSPSSAPPSAASAPSRTSPWSRSSPPATTASPPTARRRSSSPRSSRRSAPTSSA